MERKDKKILVVDDDSFSSALLSRQLQTEGHEKIECATDGSEALRLLEAHADYDLVLLDIIMPGMSGIEVLQKIKSDQRLRNIPVIMLSGVEDMDVITESLQHGADDYIAKPFNQSLLRARTLASLERKHLRDELLKIKPEADG